MKLSFAVLIAVFTVFTMGYGYGSGYRSGMMNGATKITQLVPQSTSAGDQGFMLTVNGTGFTNQSVVYWQNLAQPTAFVNPNQVLANIPASQIGFPATVQVYVRTNNQKSNSVTFMVN
jgi:hypothetical protein